MCQGLLGLGGMGIWKGSDVTQDMAQLQAQILAMSKALVEFTGTEAWAQSISSGLQSLNPVI